MIVRYYLTFIHDAKVTFINDAKIGVIFEGSCLKQIKLHFNHRNVVFFCI